MILPLGEVDCDGRSKTKGVHPDCERTGIPPSGCAALPRWGRISSPPLEECPNGARWLENISFWFLVFYSLTTLSLRATPPTEGNLFCPLGKWHVVPKGVQRNSYS